MSTKKKNLRVRYGKGLRDAEKLSEPALRAVMCDFIDRVEMLDTASMALAAEIDAWRRGAPPVQNSYKNLWAEDLQQAGGASPDYYQVVMGGPPRPLRLKDLTQKHLVEELRKDTSRLQQLQELAYAIVTATDCMAKMCGQPSLSERLVAPHEGETARTQAVCVEGEVSVIEDEVAFVEVPGSIGPVQEYRFSLDRLQGRKSRLKVGTTVLLELDAMGIVDKAHMLPA